MMTFLALLAVSYLLGAIPFALILGKLLRGIDIRQHGSGNVGATNAMRVIGAKAGAVCLLMDFAKGLVPTLLGKILITEAVTAGSVTISTDLMWLLVGVMAVMGHCFPIYLMTYGGKGIATSLGVFAALMPLPTLGCFVIGVTIIGTTGYVAIASCIGATLLPILGWALEYPLVYIGVTAALAVMIDLRHSGNIRRFVKGVEPRVWDKAAAKQTDEGVGGTG